MTYTVVSFVFVLLVNCAISQKCLKGIQGGTCTYPEENENSSISPEISTHTAEPLPRPKALNMMSEDEDEEKLYFQPVYPTSTTTTTSSSTPSITTSTAADTTTILTTTTPTNATDEPKGRAINFDLEEHSQENVLMSNNTSTKHSMEDLSDVSMDDDDETHEEIAGKIITSRTANNVSLGTSCIKAGLTYENGEKLETGCDSVCTCINGTMNCTDRCLGPYFRKGKKIDDPLCVEKEVEDPCCAILVCATDTETQPKEVCFYKNKTYKKNERIEDGCDSLCTCEGAGKVSCRPRCVLVNKTSDRCVEVPDPADSCCKKVLCDVTLDDHDTYKEQEEVSKLKLLTARFLNSTTIKLEFDVTLDGNHTLPDVEVSENRISWTTFNLLPGGYLHNPDADAQYVKIKNSNDIIEIENKPSSQMKDSAKACEYKGKQLKIGEEFNDNCTSLCVCRETGVQCLKIECPTYFGVDVLNPSCIEWETEPANFTPSPPNCCPKSVKCKNTGSCLYGDELYSNWQQIPTNVTGCEKRCYCEMNKVNCQNICPPVQALPPSNLACPPHLAILDHLPHDDCCMYWTCSSADVSTGTIQNITKEMKENENSGKETNMSYSDPFAFIPTKPPSKILGPLLVYTNKEPDNNNVTNEPPELHLLPNITVDENPYYKGSLEDHENNYNMKNEDSLYGDFNDRDRRKPTKDNSDNSPFLGPLLPTNFPPVFPSKQSKLGNKAKPNKIVNTNFIPPDQPQIPPITPNKQPVAVPNGPHIEIHGKGDPDELLQFINQHPELANYPSGSVFEIHNIPETHQQKPDIPQHLNPNALPPNNRPIVPYVIPGLPQHPQDDLPPGINVEHILQHIQKNAQQPFIPFPPNAQIPSHNGQLLITAPNGLIIPQHNLTRPGMNGQMFPGGFLNVPPGFQQSQDEINVHNVEAIDGHTVRLAFSVPPVIVGLHGRVEVRYTYKDDNDPNTWQLQVFAPPNDLIETAQLEFDLLGLKEDTEYKIKITVTLRDLHNTPSSRVYNVRTLKDMPVTTLPPMIPVEPNLVVTDINATWVNTAWRKLTDYELQFIDGVQLRYREIDGKIYAATPLIHRAVTSYTLENLKPNTKYEAGIFFIPFPGQMTELHAENMIHFTTANEFDSYGFNVTLDISQVKATSVEITWSGVPYPEDKYVNIYRAIYQSDSGKGDFSTFKVAKRDLPPKTTIMDLKPGVRYRLWLEVYLTNGRIKTSNVQDFTTKPRSVPTLGASTQQGKLEAGDLSEHKGDYYGPLVIVAILAAIAILSTLILLLILVKRHSQNKAAITPPPRVSQSAYDNPTYKVEIQQETMDL